MRVAPLSLLAIAALVLASSSSSSSMAHAAQVGSGSCEASFNAPGVTPSECAAIVTKVSTEIEPLFVGSYGAGSSLETLCTASGYTIEVVLGDQSNVSCANFSEAFSAMDGYCISFVTLLDQNVQASLAQTVSAFSCLKPTENPGPDVSRCTCTCSCQSPLNQTVCAAFDYGCSAGLGVGGEASCNAGSTAATCSNLECSDTTAETCSGGCVAFAEQYGIVCTGAYAKQGADADALATGAIAGIVIGCVLGVAIVGVIIFYVLRRKSYSKL